MNIENTATSTGNTSRIIWIVCAPEYLVFYSLKFLSFEFIEAFREIITQSIANFGIFVIAIRMAPEFLSLKVFHFYQFPMVLHVSD